MLNKFVGCFSGITSFRQYLPGLLVSITVAFAASFISAQYNGPTILYALLLGMAFNFLSEDKKCSPGVQFSATYILRFGVALLGVRITIEQMYSLNSGVIATLCVAVVATILFGLLLAYILKLPKEYGILSGCAVGICGASAALAVSSVLSQKEKNLESYTVLTVLGVTAFSTAAMVIYPMVAEIFNLNAVQSGIFLGGTIHDVAQVAGAGYIMSEEVGDTAIIVKLLRVALLLPIVLLLSLKFQNRNEGEPIRVSTLLPFFLIAFIVIVILNSCRLIPQEMVVVATDLSRMCLIISIAALGIRTSFKDLTSGGPVFVGIMAAETVFIAVVILAALLMIG